ncbi:phenylalanyl-tRNA synthetase beta chain [Parelusimicrobium proximum]|uniref:phenylalanine--tRNA ligase subunit beta n=1 Tax=Parelusimicrobium proximum TaxID=3228953 RepID=UPI003D1643B2
MKILYSWLKDYIDINLPAEELAKKLTSIGIEVAEISKTGVDFEGVYTAKILEIDKHPNADKLSLVTLDTGSGRQRVVCGAKNFKLGDVVPLAKVGARLGDFILKPAEIRGVVSEGMMCSSDELGLQKDRASGILILDPSLPLGKAVNDMYPKQDYVFELEITPNRPDLLSHRGVAREIATLLNIPLKKQEIKNIEGKGEKIKVNILDTAACPRYSGRVIKNAKNTESPDWMKARLAAMGTNPKNALVDITNYVLYDIGHPLHAFDISDVDGREINVRFAREGEEFTALDGSELKLNETNLVISGKEKASALAGVMGGIGSGIKESTTEVFIESAYFYPPVINKTAKAYGMSSESSQRFERGADIEAAAEALAKATALTLEICGGEAGEVTDEYPAKYKPAEIVFTPSEINKILGIEVPEDKMKGVFSSLASEFKAGDKWLFTAPSWRRDLNTKWDLAEEAARFYGFENIPSLPQAASVSFHDNPKNVDTVDYLSDCLVSQGFYECKNFDFVSEKELDIFGSDKKNVIELTNPLNEDWQYLRTHLLGGLLRNAAYNQDRGNKEYKMFEAGKEYLLMKGFPSESWALAAVMCGYASEPHFKNKPAEIDFYYAKGVAESLISRFDGVEITQAKDVPAYMHPKMTMDITIEGKKTVGFVGKLHPMTAKHCGLKNDNIYVIYLSVKNIEKMMDVQSFKPAEAVAQFPASHRDYSMLFDKSVSYDKIERAVQSCGIWSKYSYRLVDVYEGEKLGADKKSITLSFSFWLEDNTLKDKEVEEISSKITGALKALGGEQR